MVNNFTRKLEEYCSDCQYIEPTTEKVGMYANEGLVLNDILFTCEHYDRCKRIYEYLKEKMNER